MTNTQRTTAPTTENRTSDKEASVMETKTTGLTLRAGRSEDAEASGSILYAAFEAIADARTQNSDAQTSRLRNDFMLLLLSN